MELILVKHAETFENAARITQGQLDTKLSPTGKKQAKKVSERLKDVKIDIAYSSDLSRALDTCEAILKHHAATKLIATKDLREQAKGKFQGKTQSEKKAMGYDPGQNYATWKPDGGESLTEVWERLIPFVEEIIEKNKNKTILIVSHGGPIACLLAYFDGKTVNDFGYYLTKKGTAVSIIQINSSNVNIKLLNDASHLS